MKIYVIDRDWKQRALLTFSLSRESINALPLDPAEPVRMSQTEPQIFLICDEHSTRHLVNRVPPQSIAFCYATQAQVRDVVAALQAGAKDYFAWPEGFEEMVKSIRQFRDQDRTTAVADGGTIEAPWGKGPLPAARDFSEGNAADPSIGVSLSRREREVLELASFGLSTQAIGEKLGISPRTVDAHRNSILIKTRCNNIAEAVRWGLLGRVI